MNNIYSYVRSLDPVDIEIKKNIFILKHFFVYFSYKINYFLCKKVIK